MRWAKELLAAAIATAMGVGCLAPLQALAQDSLGAERQYAQRNTGPINPGVGGLERPRGMHSDVRSLDRHTIFGGTSRILINGTRPGERFGDVVDPQRALRLFETRGTVPLSHVRGRIERPKPWVAMPDWMPNPLPNEKENSTQHIVLEGVGLTGEAKGRQEDIDFSVFNSRVIVNMRETESKQAVLYLHGNNTSFEESNLRTIQLKHDVRGDRLTWFLYSWPSGGGGEWDPRTYPRGTAEVESAAQGCGVFLANIARLPFEELFIVEFSKGADLGRFCLEDGISRLGGASSPLAKKLKKLAVVAGDAHQDVFLEKTMPLLRKLGTEVTVFCRSGDGWLSAAESVWGKPRIGQCGPNTMELKGIDSIDLSPAAASNYGHNLLGMEALLADLGDWFVDKLRPYQGSRARRLLKIDGRPGQEAYILR